MANLDKEGRIHVWISNLCIAGVALIAVLYDKFPGKYFSSDELVLAALALGAVSFSSFLYRQWRFQGVSKRGVAAEVSIEQRTIVRPMAVDAPPISIGAVYDVERSAFEEILSWENADRGAAKAEEVINFVQNMVRDDSNRTNRLSCKAAVWRIDATLSRDESTTLSKRPSKAHKAPGRSLLDHAVA